MPDGLTRLGQKAVSIAKPIVQKGIEKGREAIQREVHKRRVQASLIALKKLSEGEIRAMEGLLNVVTPGSTVALNLADLIRSQRNEISVLANMLRLMK